MFLTIKKWGTLDSSENKIVPFHSIPKTAGFSLYAKVANIDRLATLYCYSKDYLFTSIMLEARGRNCELFSLSLGWPRDDSQSYEILEEIFSETGALESIVLSRSFVQDLQKLVTLLQESAIR